jgi:predicted Fe-Mo cluster-binding NifX family protein
MSSPICVSIPTDDGKTVKLGHFGDGRYYYHYVYENGAWRLVRVVENLYAGEHEHGSEEDEENSKRPKIFELNKGCTHIVAVAFGPGGQEFMEKRGLRVIRVRPRTSIEDALKAIEAGLRQA